MLGISLRLSGIRAGFCTSCSRSWRIAKLKASSPGLIFAMEPLKGLRPQFENHYRLSTLKCLLGLGLKGVPENAWLSDLEENHELSL
ncbi:hypothetical protein E2C01_005377 [Portunus trituberculatus]|uniref:Uncharacterized protein n=1 Tax=Portunus trituberculatus TaxID=210409 RepID=A0A5B7CZ10_PORTR|nr:hypothetical protein [Portunus trituberculatus]